MERIDPRIPVILPALLLAAAMLWPPGASGFATDSHPDLAMAAFNVLDHDGRGREARLFSALGQDGAELWRDLLQGEVDADSVLQNRDHYYDPYTGQGLAGLSDAATVCQDYYDSAVRRWPDDWRQAAYDLGKAAHLLQDCSMPHHVRLDPLDGHAELEAWLSTVLGNYSVADGGWYGRAGSARDLCTMSALLAYGLYPEACSGDESQYRQVAAEAVPDAERATAALIDMFLQDVSSEAPSLLAMPSSTATRVDLVWAPCASPGFVRYEVYVSHAGRPLGDPRENGTLVARIAEAEDNTASLGRIWQFGDYEFAVLTVYGNGTAVESSVLRVHEEGWTGIAVLVALSATAAVGIAVLAIAGPRAGGRRKGGRRS